MALNTSRTAPRKSLVSFVEDAIRDALIEGRLEPGTRLVTRDLAEELGVSITPVREALVRFAASSVLTAEPASSFRVPTLDSAQYTELMEIRQSVEGLAAAKAAPRIGRTEIRRMEVLLGQYLTAKSANKPHEALKTNKAFRFTLYEAAGMPTLISVIEMLWLKAGPGFHYLFPEAQRDYTEHRNYNKLLEALRVKSPAAARAAIEQTIVEGGDAVLAAIAAREAAAA